MSVEYNRRLAESIVHILTSDDFACPLLYKLYKYMLLIHKIGINVPIRQRFTESEINTIIYTLKHSTGNTDFIDKFNEGICENRDLRHTENIRNYVERTFESSIYNQITNPIMKSLYPNQSTNGEMDVLDCLLYQYARQVFEPFCQEEIGFYINDATYLLKKKEYQLIEMNKLFGNFLQKHYSTLNNIGEVK